MKRNKNTNLIYEPKDDVLNIWLSKKLIDYAEAENGVITHYTKDDEPVYIEVLNASKFFKQSGKSSTKPAASVLHKIKK